MDNFEHDFLEGCKRVGVKNTSRLKYPPKHYRAVYVDRTNNGKDLIGVKEFHLAVGGGEYKVAKVAYQLLNTPDDSSDLEVPPTPQWFQQFVANTASFAQSLWGDISTQIKHEVDERVQMSEAAKNQAEREQAIVEDYLEDIIAEKETLEVTVEELAGYSQRNEQLKHQVKDLARDKQHIENKLSDAIEELNSLRSYTPELQSLRTQVAILETELEHRSQQTNDLRIALDVVNSLKSVSKDTETLTDDTVNEGIYD
ncbi:hypothetical protein [Vibrio sp. F13]|uniref:hypothetical protein n=1 Tax=Vibrio sp. F13 TaxID=2070777 RepID=UPI0010BD354F|nr:hypothetical protein [Vibrio sp. F13]TKF96990.1 hypothetical protein FCV76_22480 [Vibrio sp. F13]